MIEHDSPLILQDIDFSSKNAAHSVWIGVSSIIVGDTLVRLRWIMGDYFA
jgi:hypothetical protein